MSGKYLVARDAFGSGDLSWPGDDILAQLVSLDYGFDERHRTIDQVAGEVGDPAAVRDTQIADGWARCATVEFPQIKGAEVAALIFYRESDGMLIEYHDAVDRFPMTPNGGDITIAAPVPGFFRI